MRTLFYSTNPMQLFNYVRQCLATELRLIQIAGVEGPANMDLLGASTGAEVIHKLELLRRKTQVPILFNLQKNIYCTSKLNII